MLREAKRAVAASLGLRRPSADAREAAFASAAARETVGAAALAAEERAGPLYRRGGWRAAVSAIRVRLAKRSLASVAVSSNSTGDPLRPANSPSATAVTRTK